MPEKMNKSALAHANGLGSSHSGVAHWWLQRVTAIALIPLLIWFIAGIIAYSGAGYQAVLTWLANPVIASLMVLTLISAFYHAALGLQVVVEDYLHHEGWKLTLLLLIRFSCIFLATISLVAVLTIAIKG